MSFVSLMPEPLPAYGVILRGTGSAIADEECGCGWPDDGVGYNGGRFGAGVNGSAMFCACRLVEVATAMAAQVHDLSGKPGVAPWSLGTQASAFAIASGPGRAYRGRLGSHVPVNVLVSGL